MISHQYRCVFVHPGALGKQKTILPHLNKGDRRGVAREFFANPVDRDLFLRHFGRDFEDFDYEP